MSYYAGPLVLMGIFFIYAHLFSSATRALNKGWVFLQAADKQRFYVPTMYKPHRRHHCYILQSSQFLVTPLRSIRPPRSSNNVSPAVALTFLQAFPTISASSSIILIHFPLGFPLLCCLWGFQLKAGFALAKESYVNVCLVLFLFHSLI